MPSPPHKDVEAISAFIQHRGLQLRTEASGAGRDDPRDHRLRLFGNVGIGLGMHQALLGVTHPGSTRGVCLVFLWHSTESLLMGSRKSLVQCRKPGSPRHNPPGPRSIVTVERRRLFAHINSNPSLKQGIPSFLVNRIESRSGLARTLASPSFHGGPESQGTTGKTSS